MEVTTGKTAVGEGFSRKVHIGQFKVYQDGADLSYLHSLGPLIKPERVDRLAELKLEEYQMEQPHSALPDHTIL